MLTVGTEFSCDNLSVMFATKSVVEGCRTRLRRFQSDIIELFLDQFTGCCDGPLIRDGWQGNMIHCSAKATVAHNFLRLKVGSIYSVKIFVVKPNKEEYQILNNDTYMLKFDALSNIEKLSKAEGFVRLPVPIAGFWMWSGYVPLSGNKSLKIKLEDLNFHLADHRLVALLVIPLTSHRLCLSVKHFHHTVIYDDGDMLAIKHLTKN
ncbi:hypothetical protein Tco_1161536, partial [Tanacetum coccineum]